MPIKPENMKLYPGGSIRSPEWLAIREQVRLRAHDLCEECGVPNGARGVRNPYTGEWLGSFPHGTTVTFPALNGSRIVVPIIKIVCTVAHVDNKLVDHSLENLRFWCQRCHLTHDREMRKAEAK